MELVLNMHSGLNNLSQANITIYLFSSHYFNIKMGTKEGHIFKPWLQKGVGLSIVFWIEHLLCAVFYLYSNASIAKKIVLGIVGIFLALYS